jgi:phage-related minor tail protein
MGSLGTLLVKVSASIRDFETKMDQVDSRMAKTSKNFQRAGKSMMKGGAVMTAAITAPIMLAGRMGVEEMKAIEQANARSAQALEKFAGKSIMTISEMQRRAQYIQGKSGIDDQVIQEMQNVIITMGEMNLAQEEGVLVFQQTSLAASGYADALGVDAVSAGKLFAKSIQAAGQGLLVLPRGMKMSKEAQERLKKAFEDTDNPIKRQLMMSEMLNNKYGEMHNLTNADKWAVAQDGLAGVAASLVVELLPAFQKGVELLTKFNNWFSKLNPTTKKFIAYGAAIAAVLGPVIIFFGMLASAIGALIPVFAALGGGGLIAAIGGAFAALMGPIGLIIAAIAGVVVVGYLIYKNWDKIKAGLVKVWNGIKKVTEKVWNGIIDFFKQWGPWMIAALLGPVGLVAKLIYDNWEKIKQITTAAWNAVTTAIQTALNNAWNALGGFLVKAVDIARTIGDAIKGGILGAMSSLGSGLIDMIKGAINGMISAVNKGIGGINKGIHFANKLPGVDVPDIPNIPMLAKGGLAYGPTIAGIGEYAGARSNPEVVAPLDKLKEMIGGGSGVTIQHLEVHGNGLPPKAVEAMLIRSLRRAQASY